MFGLGLGALKLVCILASYFSSFLLSHLPPWIFFTFLSIPSNPFKMDLKISVHLGVLTWKASLVI